MGLTVNRQMGKKLTVNRQKKEYFYSQPLHERAKISRQISQKSLNDRDRLTFFSVTEGSTKEGIDN